MPQRLKKFVSCLLVLAFIGMTMSLFAGHADAGGADASSAKHGPAVGKLASADRHAPCCPCEGDHSTSEHCNPLCSCGCHVHLLVETVQLVLSRVATPLEFHDPIKAIPEVYLSTFVPPHIRILV